MACSWRGGGEGDRGGDREMWFKESNEGGCAEQVFER